MNHIRLPKFDYKTKRLLSDERGDVKLDSDQLFDLNEQAYEYHKVTLKEDVTAIVTDVFPANKPGSKSRSEECSRKLTEMGYSNDEQFIFKSGTEIAMIWTNVGIQEVEGGFTFEIDMGFEQRIMDQEKYIGVVIFRILLDDRSNVKAAE